MGQSSRKVTSLKIYKLGLAVQKNTVLFMIQQLTTNGIIILVTRKILPIPYVLLLLNEVKPYCVLKEKTIYIKQMHQKFHFRPMYFHFVFVCVVC